MSQWREYQDGIVSRSCSKRHRLIVLSPLVSGGRRQRHKNDELNQIDASAITVSPICQHSSINTRTWISRYIRSVLSSLDSTDVAWLLQTVLYEYLRADLFLCFTARCMQCKARYCYCKSSVRPSIRPSVTLMYRGHIGWTIVRI